MGADFEGGLGKGEIVVELEIVETNEAGGSVRIKAE